MENPTSKTPTSASDSLTATLCNSIQALGRGFDVTSDFRLLYCKGAPGSRLVHLDEDPASTRDLVVSDGVVLPNVSVDIDCSPGKSVMEKIPVCSFHEMAKYFNERSGLTGQIPLGSFNSMFNFTGSCTVDAAATKSLAMVGYFNSLFEVKLTNLNLVLNEEIKRSVPHSWDPASLACFIENYGTHIVTSTTIGGRDVVYIRQHQLSCLSTQDIENYVKDIGDDRFHDVKNLSGPSPLKYKEKDVTVIFRRRGGNDFEQNHSKWVETVKMAPDIINMTFMPIVSLLEGVPGVKHLMRAIDLYLEYKPPVEDLQYFLDFQLARVWAPEQSNVQRKEPVCPSLQFSLMGPKLYVSSDQVTVGRKPVTGLRLSLEGGKQNRLAIHLQHLVSLPKNLIPHWDTHMAIGAPKWQGPEEQDSRWFEPIKWKKFSHVSTAPIEYTETSIGDLSGVHIVTGAQLGVWDFGAKNVLHLKLLFSKVPGCTIRRSVWDHSPSTPSAIAQRLDGARRPKPSHQASLVHPPVQLSVTIAKSHHLVAPFGSQADVAQLGKLEEDMVVEGKVDWKGRKALKHKHGGIKVSLLILATFAFENMATLSLAVNLVSYFNVFMHYDLADAANMVTNFMGVSYILSIVVAVLADTLIGRYKSVLISGFFEFLGLALLTVQAHYASLKPPICNVFDKNAKCSKLSGSHEAFLFISLYLLAFGSAGLKASLPSHGADQFDEKDPKEARQMSSFFNGLLLAVCIGGAVSLTFNVWIQDNKGWDWGFGISTIAIVYIAAIRNRNLPLPADPVLGQSSHPRQTDVQPDNSEAPSPWKLCRVTQHHGGERKRVARDNNMLDALPGVEPLPLSIFWLSFQYFVFGIADMFTYVGLLEFFYSEAPKGLKSTSTCFLWSSMALAIF
ncbi:Proton-dependent oligopeptide transporter family [Sesbania bispinosa]|nr:Proton-dependent oligopeptide transporter family [Sesbania bispinosa]